MYELISREWVLKNLMFDVDKDLVKAAPKVDAVEVVRCKDCMLWTRTEKRYGKCVFLAGEQQRVREDHYCGLGEVKENAAD